MYRDPIVEEVRQPSRRGAKKKGGLRSAYLLRSLPIYRQIPSEKGQVNNRSATLDKIRICNYNNYILSIWGDCMESKLINIGNSKGIRLPKKLIQKYHLDEKLTLEEKKEGILIKADIPDNKLSWDETYKEMAKEKEDWSDFDNLAADGIDQ
jgi:antitoxin MazE